MRRLIPAILIGTLVILLVGVVQARPDKNDSDQPQVSGMTQGNTGCAILEKHTPVKGKLLVVGVIYARTEYKVLTTFHATLPREKFTGPGQVKELNSLAVKDRIKLVVLRPNYSDAEFARAKSMCGQPANAPAASTPSPSR
ncbi:MAG TPA: hypothetical protein VGZ29_08975 [Terriglobia bacterium]|nr:hypothetical protein [Terriglobia bacterium]